ncbi:unnamed protein product [Triticum turgidum subsp. durum]|uniref:Uncharacterized protein n=1 Tax=Triticum turgidum subsp. durum TaxID=4567 RepID=A0A9R0ZX43_TRITD|nr:unnamed protein product [Triticum turgidum subsp. durum]
MARGVGHIHEDNAYKIYGRYSSDAALDYVSDFILVVVPSSSESYDPITITMGSCVSSSVDSTGFMLERQAGC